MKTKIIIPILALGAIGLAALEQALERTTGEVRAEIHFQPFELNPQMPAEGEDITEHLQRKYGLSEAQLVENQERIRERGAELGFSFGMVARKRTWNTFDAHRLLHWAGLEGEGKQAAPGTTKNQPARDAQRFAQVFEVGDQMCCGIGLGIAERPTAAATALVEHDDPVLGRIEIAPHARIDRPAGAAVQHQDRPALRIAAFLVIDLVNAVGGHPA